MAQPNSSSRNLPSASSFVGRYGAWAVVTGTSDGIGRAFAVELARRGLNLVLVARRDVVLHELAQMLSTDFQVETKVAALDLGAPTANQTLIELCCNLDIGLLVAAAGFGTSGEFADISVSEEVHMIDVNCRSVVELAHHFAGRFKAQHRGGIVLMSSLVAFQGVPRAATYSASKAFIQSFAEGIQHELAPYHVDVVASAPGPVFSGFMARADMKSGMGVSSETVARQTLAALGRHALVRPGFVSKFLEWSLRPLPRWGRVRMMGIVMGGMTKHQTSIGEAAAKEQNA